MDLVGDFRLARDPVYFPLRLSKASLLNKTSLLGHIFNNKPHDVSIDQRLCATYTFLIWVTNFTLVPAFQQLDVAEHAHGQVDLANADPIRTRVNEA